MRVETIGKARLYLADCREVFPGLSGVDAVVTDPPFGIGFKYASHDDRPEAYEGGYGAWLWSILQDAEAACNPGSPIFVWQASLNIRQFSNWFPRDWRMYIGARNFVQILPTAMQYAYDPVIVWWTDGAKPWALGNASRDWHIADTTPGRKEKEHPCPRPLDQVGHIIDHWVRPAGTVIDPFAGSGTTGVACSQLDRPFIGIERDPGYFDIMCRRIEAAQRQGDMLRDIQPAPKLVTGDLWGG